MTKIFISYRRADSITITGRIYDRLVAEYGRDNIFKDVDNIPPGVDFRDFIESEIQDCAAVLVIIGQQWSSITNDQGIRRLEIPGDPVRTEIELALSNNIQIIPVLVNNAQMPKELELPSEISGLAYINGVLVREDPDFHQDVNRLIKSVQPNIQTEDKPTAAIKQVEELILDTNGQIQLEKIFRSKSKVVFEDFTSNEFYERLDNTAHKLNQINDLVLQSEFFTPYLKCIESSLSMVTTLCLYGTTAHGRLITDLIEGWSRVPQYPSQQYGLPLQYTPLWFLVYSAGIATCLSKKWHFLPAIMSNPIIKAFRSSNSVIPTIADEIYYRIISSTRIKPQQLNLLIEKQLEKIFLEYHEFDIDEYARAFDMFEMFLALVYLRTKNSNSITSDKWMPSHRSIDNSRSWNYLIRFWKNAGKENKNWEFLKLDLFGDNPSIVRDILEKYVATAHRFQSSREQSPDYAELYGHGTWGYMIHADDRPISDF